MPDFILGILGFDLCLLKTMSILEVNVCLKICLWMLTELAPKYIRNKWIYVHTYHLYVNKNWISTKLTCAAEKVEQSCLLFVRDNFSSLKLHT